MALEIGLEVIQAKKVKHCCRPCLPASGNGDKRVTLKIGNLRYPGIDGQTMLQVIPARQRRSHKGGAMETGNLRYLGDDGQILLRAMPVGN